MLHCYQKQIVIEQCRATGVPPATWGAARKLRGAAKDFEKYFKFLGFLRTNKNSVSYGNY
jgi:hypothetical protein